MRSGLPPFRSEARYIRFGEDNPQIGANPANAAPVSERIIFVCDSCGTPGVTREAWAAWDVGQQAWVLAELFDYAFCHRCHRRTQLEERAAEGE